MNTYMELNIKSLISYLEAFKTQMKMCAMKDDATIDKQEEKVLKKINKLTDKYMDELEAYID